MKENEDELTIEVLPIKKATLMLRTASHSLRQQMLQLMVRHGRLTVTEIYTQLEIDQSVASAHLALLRLAGFVCTDRSGRHLYYTVNPARMEALQQFIGRLLQ